MTLAAVVAATITGRDAIKGGERVSVNARHCAGGTLNVSRQPLDRSAQLYFLLFSVPVVGRISFNAPAVACRT